MSALRYQLRLYGEGILNSYAQIFFSNSRLLAGLLLLISFFDVGAGLSGVLSILIAQVTAVLFNFSHALIRDGSYTYNVLMVGIALGVFYEFNGSFILLLGLTSVLMLFLTIWFAVAFEKRGLPFLSIPFLIGIWMIILGVPNFSALALNEKQVFSLVKWFPELFEGVTGAIGSLPFSDAIHLYLRSLGAIFFQYNDLAGLIITLGLLLYSRIAFGLSIFGFGIGYCFYLFFEGDFSQLIYSYIGFNFILTAIALGGFFVVPSRKSYLILLFTIPVIALLISALHTLFTYFQLPLYSLPFNIVTLLFLAAMATRHKASGITLVTAQQFSPEKNHYKHLNSVARFQKDTYFHIGLPIIGTWRVPQGHAGGITHKEDWQYALDFDVVDEAGSTYRMPGVDPKDYYCYDLPVVAPADGYVVELLDGIEDNKIGDVNLKNNWGNTVIIKHGEHFYSKLSHFKKGTFKVKVGDYVVKGQLLGNCGSSGRSPEPHLHFQLQRTPYIGSKTLDYPIAYFLTNKNGSHTFHAFEIPEEGSHVCNVQKTPILSQAFGFIPGKTMTFRFEDQSYKWEVFTNALNQTYLYCHTTGSTAYFVNNGTLFYFTDFYGESGSLLHHFYYGAQKVLLGYYDQVQLEDRLLIDGFFPKWLSGLHDFTAPFFHYCKVSYGFAFESCDNLHNPSLITFNSQCVGTIGEKKYKHNRYRFTIKDGAITSFQINEDKEAVCEDC